MNFAPEKKIAASDVMHGLVMVVAVEAFIITMTSKFYCFYLEKWTVLSKQMIAPAEGGGGWDFSP